MGHGARAKPPYHRQANDGLRKLPLDKYTAASGVGLPYPTAELGPPRPRCHDARVATLRAMNILDTPPQPNIGAGTMTSEPPKCHHTPVFTLRATHTLGMPLLDVGARTASS